MAVANGTLTYNRRTRQGDFEHREATAVINWDTGQYQTDDVAVTLETASALAETSVNRLLGITPRPTPSATSAPVTAAPAASEVPPPKPRGKKPAEPSTTNSAQILPTSSEKAPDPVSAVPSTEAGAVDELDEMLGGTAPVEEEKISDTDLQKIIQTKVASLLKADDAAHNTKVRQLVIATIKGYGVDSASKVPSDKRREFLEKIGKLK